MLASGTPGAAAQPACVTPKPTISALTFSVLVSKMGTGLGEGALASRAQPAGPGQSVLQDGGALAADSGNRGAACSWELSLLG